ncbi:MAG TPA: hypothetical protein VNA17_00940 [Pyrinomonadaceae bacterium]|nr:hypothetical protein [Pyrinomonadaceae bacterium]
MKTNLMNLSARTILSVLFALLITSACFAQTSAHNESLENRGNDKGLVGTWDASVRIKDCNTGNVLNSFASIASFNEGGTTIGSTSGIPQAARTPEHGVWRRVSNRTYMFKFKSYSFNPTGQPTGYSIVAHTITLDPDGDGYYSEGTATFYTMAGVPVGHGCSDANAVRFEL